MAKSTDGIEEGSFQTSGVNDPIDEPKQRGGDGSAVMEKPKSSTPNHHFAHKRPVTG
jgi:hypothetical protein